ncbi:CopG family antitoxin [Spirobacillus cienkowskii]|uniref:CopG family antitoxin n=1 Tax=Spirobacillus cienkowskii TaxID=495820 RepID=UPI0030CAFDBE
MKKKLPKLTTDKEAEEFIDQDLSEYMDNDDFKLTTFEFAPKNKSITIRISDPLLNCIQSFAKEEKVSYQKIVRQALEEYIRKKKKKVS